MDQYKIIQVKESVFADNDREADRVRQQLKGPGDLSAESDVLPRQRQDHHPAADRGGLKDQLRMGVMEADIDSDVDAAAMAQRRGPLHPAAHRRHVPPGRPA